MVLQDSNTSVPFMDLKAPHLAIRQQLASVLNRSIEEAEFIGGPMVDSFESAFADYTHTPHCIGVGSGTDALRFALIAAGIQPGDAVVTVPNTFIATAEAISQAGARPFFVDVDENTCNMDARELRRFFESECHEDWNGHLVTNRGTRRIRAIVPVHLYGQPADMDPILQLARTYNVLVIEDACQAHGAEYFSRSSNRWLRTGSIGHAAAFSFYPGKNLGACGEAGAVTTHSADLARQIRILRDHGQDRKYHHNIEGYNGRLDAIQAGFLSVKLVYLNAWNQARREAGKLYNEYFDSVESVQPVHQLSTSRSVFHLYVVSVPQRDRIRERLTAAGIHTGIHYPLPLHLQPAYRRLGYRWGDFPVTERLASRILSLPMFPQLGPAQIEYVSSTVVRLSRELAQSCDGYHGHSHCQTS